MKIEAKKILEFLHITENLKKLIRHSWLSNGREESVAEHTWRVSIMFLLIEPHLDIKINTLRTLEMIVIHDIIEALVGDVPAFEAFDQDVKLLKIQEEGRAIEEIKNMLRACLKMREE